MRKVFDIGNGGGNPAAAFDVDVSNDAIGGLGSPLCYAILRSPSFIFRTSCEEEHRQFVDAKDNRIVLKQPQKHGINWSCVQRYDDHSLCGQQRRQISSGIALPEAKVAVTTLVLMLK